MRSVYRDTSDGSSLQGEGVLGQGDCKWGGKGAWGDVVWGGGGALNPLAKLKKAHAGLLLISVLAMGSA